MSTLSNAIGRFHHHLANWQHRLLKESGLTAQQMHTIELIGYNAPLRLKDLSARLDVVMGTLTVMIDRLEKLGYVVRSKNPDDGRSYQVSLTDKGTHYFYDYHHKFNAMIKDIEATLTTDEAQRFTDILGRVDRALTSGEGGA